MKLFIFVLISFISFGCSATDLPLVKVGEREFFHNNSSMTWIKSFQFCALHQLQLLTIHSALDNFYISEYMKSNNIKSAWTSGTDSAKEGVWMWMSTGLEMTFKDFVKPLPDNNNNNSLCYPENCLLIGFSPEQQCMIWDDVQCMENHNFICQKP